MNGRKDDFRDNTEYKTREIKRNRNELYRQLINKTLKDLSDKDILVFPKYTGKRDGSDNDASLSPDKESKIIETINKSHRHIPSNDKFETNEKTNEDNEEYARFGNIIGFVGYKSEQLIIRSRFSYGNDDYFLHYMLQKILNINLVSLDISHSYQEQIHQLLMYFFPSLLNKALRKGIFRQYRRYRYNDINIKGSIDVARHIKENTPFLGRVAYSTREFTKDNYLIQLIRHTIEHIRTSSRSGWALLNSTDETRQNVNAVELATLSYSMGDRRRIIIENKKTSARHTYYTEYRELQHLCLMILDYKKHDLKGDKDMHGILFDVSWLWEEYLYTLLREFDFVHPSNRDEHKTDWVSIYRAEDSRLVCPDYYIENYIVADAKYKRLDKKYLEREDLYQLIAYSYIMGLGESESAVIIHPGGEYNSEDAITVQDTNDDGEKPKAELVREGILNGYGSTMYRISLRIPQYKIEDKRNKTGESWFKLFVEDMEKVESEFNEHISNLLEKSRYIS